MTPGYQNTRSGQTPGVRPHFDSKEYLSKLSEQPIFFSHRIVHLWNNLLESVYSTVCNNNKIIPFRTKLYLLYKNKLSTHFNIDDTSHAHGSPTA